MNFDRITFDIRLGGYLEADPFESRGIRAKGGGGNGIDAAYNARMASVAEAQQAIAQKNFDFWESDYKPMEQAMINSNIALIPHETNYQAIKLDNEAALIPHQTDYEIKKMTAEEQLFPSQTKLGIAQNEAALSLLPQQTEYAMAKLSDDMQYMEEKAPVRNAFFRESLEGVDVEGRANKAAADAAHAFANSHMSMGRDMARMGVNPNSGRFAAMGTSNAISRAKGIAGAKTSARTNAEQENFSRLTNAMGY
ncbi:hypothetical protein [Desulfobacter sp.]|uniref:hypothetical protein n=1 Tax=Desulfobacter sp. TaxID=2294 RepID=UPI003D11EF5B